MVAFKNSTGIKANSSFCTFRFPIAEAHQLTKPFQYQPITTTSPTQPFAHFVFMPIVEMIMMIIHISFKIIMKVASLFHSLLVTLENYMYLLTIFTFPTRY